MAQIHPYPVKVVWSGGRDGSGAVTPENSGIELPIAVPREFQGTGDGTNPEELLACAVAACYTITFGIIAANRKIPVVNVETEALGEVEQNGAQFTYKKIAIRPLIRLSPEATDDHLKLASDMAHRADGYCIITNAVRDKVQIVVEPRIERG